MSHHKAGAALASPADSAKPTTQSTALGFPIVGIGASAGGLAALDAFFSALPADSDPGMAFVLVQHLAPDHKSLLATILQRHTHLRIREATDGTRVEANCVYTIPPDRDMGLHEGALRLFEPAAPRGRRLPIDFFFRSLAEDCHERAIAIVLSGVGADGTIGVRAVKAEGGLILAQTPESAEYDGMPGSAIATGLVDYVLPPQDMPRELIAYAARNFGTASRRLDPTGESTDSAMQTIFLLLRARTGHDFSQYKQRTIHRRIERRIAVRQVETLNAYAHYLKENPDEVTELFRDLLIGVTGFFRDPEAFAALQIEIAKRILNRKAMDAPIRVWVPGCSTGEEAYSLAMLLQEQMEAAKRTIKVQIFATDIDQIAIDQARWGVYSARALADVSPERLARFFTLEPDRAHYRIHKTLREMLIFSEQDAIKDPPFSRLDLISCRNLLIYLGAELQHKLIPLFHYALNPGGLLFLGTSESVGHFGEFFAVLQPKAKLYVRRDDVPSTWRRNTGMPLPSVSPYQPWVQPAERLNAPRKFPLRELTGRALLQYHSPAAALINAQGEVLYVHGRTGRYLEPASGESSLNILRMAREGLERDLRQALEEVATSHQVVRRPGLRVRTNGDFTRVDVTVRPLASDPGQETAARSELFLVVLEEPLTSPDDRHEASAKPDPGEMTGAAEVDARIAALRRDLESQAETLKATAEHLETSNQDLRAANEELQSVNEELQSTNEELETSKEELQAVNEELATVNAELQQRVAELSRSNNDLSNLMACTGVGTIFVDLELRIQRFTPAATAVIQLIPSDVGRPVGQIVANLVDYNRLVADIKDVLATLAPKEMEVQSTDAWYLLRIRPYRTMENAVEGVVITFTDITVLKRSQEATRRLAVVVRDSRDAVLVQDLTGHITAWNPAAERMYGWTEAEALTKSIAELTPQAGQSEALALFERLRRGEVVGVQRAQRLTKDGRLIGVSLTVTALQNDAAEVYAISTTERLEHG